MLACSCYRFVQFEPFSVKFNPGCHLNSLCVLEVLWHRNSYFGWLTRNPEDIPLYMVLQGMVLVANLAGKEAAAVIAIAMVS